MGEREDGGRRCVRKRPSASFFFSRESERWKEGRERTCSTPPKRALSGPLSCIGLLNGLLSPPGDFSSFLVFRVFFLLGFTSSSEEGEELALSSELATSFDEVCFRFEEEDRFDFGLKDEGRLEGPARVE